MESVSAVGSPRVSTTQLADGGAKSQIGRMASRREWGVEPAQQFGTSRKPILPDGYPRPAAAEGHEAEYGGNPVRKLKARYPQAPPAPIPTHPA